MPIYNQIFYKKYTPPPQRIPLSVTSLTDVLRFNGQSFGEMYNTMYTNIQGNRFEGLNYFTASNAITGIIEPDINQNTCSVVPHLNNNDNGPNEFFQAGSYTLKQVIGFPNKNQYVIQNYYPGKITMLPNVAIKLACAELDRREVWNSTYTVYNDVQVQQGNQQGILTLKDLQEQVVTLFPTTEYPTQQVYTQVIDVYQDNSSVLSKNTNTQNIFVIECVSDYYTQTPAAILAIAKTTLGSFNQSKIAIYTTQHIATGLTPLTLQYQHGYENLSANENQSVKSLITVQHLDTNDAYVAYVSQNNDSSNNYDNLYHPDHWDFLTIRNTNEKPGSASRPIANPFTYFLIISIDLT